MSKSEKVISLAKVRAETVLRNCNAQVQCESGCLKITIPLSKHRIVFSEEDDQLEESLRLIAKIFSNCVCMKFYGEPRCQVTKCAG